VAHQTLRLPGGSGGYLEYVFRRAAAELYGVEIPPGPLPLRTLRNADLREACLEVDGRTVLRFAAAYGFRNIQTLMRKIKRGACEYDYVEVMACPSGEAGRTGNGR
jgi:iron only hydrogenase large subunit-like protein